MDHDIPQIDSKIVGVKTQWDIDSFFKVNHIHDEALLSVKDFLVGNLSYTYFIQLNSPQIAHVF